MDHYKIGSRQLATTVKPVVVSVHLVRVRFECSSSALYTTPTGWAKATTFDCLYLENDCRFKWFLVQFNTCTLLFWTRLLYLYWTKLWHKWRHLAIKFNNSGFHLKKQTRPLHSNAHIFKMPTPIYKTFGIVERGYIPNVPVVIQQFVYRLVMLNMLWWTPVKHSLKAKAQLLNFARWHHLV